MYGVEKSANPVHNRKKVLEFSSRLQVLGVCKCWISTMRQLPMPVIFAPTMPSADVKSEPTMSLLPAMPAV